MAQLPSGGLGDAPAPPSTPSVSEALLTHSRSVGAGTLTGPLPLTPRQDAAVRPLEAPAGGDAGTETPEGVTGTQAGTQRRARMTANTATDDGLDWLYAELARARADAANLVAANGALRDAFARRRVDRDAERDDLRRMSDEADQLADQRDRARDIAVALEQQLAAVAALHTQWVAAGPPPLGTSLARWWDARLVEHHAALNPQEDQ